MEIDSRRRWIPVQEKFQRDVLVPCRAGKSINKGVAGRNRTGGPDPITVFLPDPGKSSLGW
jgi:hypothetical protein